MRDFLAGTKEVKSDSWAARVPLVFSRPVDASGIKHKAEKFTFPTPGFGLNVACCALITLIPTTHEPMEVVITEVATGEFYTFDQAWLADKWPDKFSAMVARYMGYIESCDARTHEWYVRCPDCGLPSADYALRGAGLEWRLMLCILSCWFHADSCSVFVLAGFIPMRTRTLHLHDSRIVFDVILHIIELVLLHLQDSL
jgi:hypothetical protein